MRRERHAGDPHEADPEPQDYRTASTGLLHFRVETLPVGVSPSTARPGDANVMHVLSADHVTALQHADVRRAVTKLGHYVATVAPEASRALGSFDRSAIASDDLARALSRRERERQEWQEMADAGYRTAPPGWHP